ncbi:hypothetical protein [Halorientalis sp.]|uniref:hypothetical protein n=1 Tax=Halorientalis sp. TaxID=1931229 RepID=UPI002620E3D8|nr:hypothetical protein [Halorientalis sp.]
MAVTAAVVGGTDGAEVVVTLVLPLTFALGVCGTDVAGSPSGVPSQPDHTATW